MTIADSLANFQNLKLRDKLPDLILQTSYDIEVLVKVQLNLGELSTGEKIAPPYADKYYAAKKEQQNPNPGFGIPDAYKSGAYYKAIGITVTPTTYDIESTVDYAHAPSIEQYGQHLLEMSVSAKEAYLQQSLGPAIGGYIFEVTGLQVV